MGTTEVKNILKKGEKLTAKEIASYLEASLPAVHVSIRRLLKDVSENINTRELTYEEKIAKFGRPMGVKVKIYWAEG